MQSIYLRSGAQRVTYTTVKGTGSCTVATAKTVRTVTLDEGRAEIRGLLGQGWELYRDMVLS